MDKGPCCNGSPALRKISADRTVTTVWTTNLFNITEPFGGLRVWKEAIFFSSGNQVFQIKEGTAEVFIGSKGDFFSSHYKDGPALVAEFRDFITFDISETGEFFLADGNRRIRKMDLQGNVETIAGSGNDGQQDGTGLFCSFSEIKALTSAPNGDLLLVDGYKIRRVSPTFEVSTVAGMSTGGYNDGPASQAKFSGASGIAVDGNGNVYVADTGNNVIRKIRGDGFVVTFGSGFKRPSDIKIQDDGSLIVADTGNNLIRKITAKPAAGDPTPQELSAKMYAGITIQGTIGQRTKIESKESLSEEWQALATITLEQSPFLWIDQDSPNHLKRVYRSVVAP